jgi:RNA polymerase sigma-70 factor, ECF subfamily
MQARETELRALVATGDLDLVTTATLRTYGGEIIGWLHTIVDTDADAKDAFSLMSEELWRSLSRYDGRCSLRTWCYMIARQSAARIRGRSHKEVLVSTIPSVQHEVTHIWSTNRRDAFHAREVYAEIRAALSDEDRTLLVLRVDRDLAWRDIAIVLLGVDAEDQAVTKRAAALRKQFERVKEQLRALAAERLGA